MPDMFVGVGGAHKKVKAGTAVGVSGVWKPIKEMYVGAGGVWKKFFVALAVNMPDEEVSNVRITPTCVAGIRLNSVGTYTKSDSSGGYSGSDGTWLAGGDAADVWVEHSITSGSLTVAPGAGRSQLSTNRIYEVHQSTDPGSTSCTFTLTFYDAPSGGNVLDTAEITLTATVS